MTVGHRIGGLITGRLLSYSPYYCFSLLLYVYLILLHTPDSRLPPVGGTGDGGVGGDFSHNGNSSALERAGLLGPLRNLRYRVTSQYIFRGTTPDSVLLLMLVVHLPYLSNMRYLDN